MRELTPDEIEFIFGGKSSIHTFDEGGGDVVVTGGGGGGVGGGGGGSTGGGSGGHGTGGGAIVTSPGGFAGAHVKISALHLTTNEAQAINKYLANLNSEVASLQNLPDNAVMTTVVTKDDGSSPTTETVTGAQVKAIVNSIQINIVDDNANTGNMTSRGAATYSNGVPTLTFTGQTVLGYTNDGVSGMDYLMLHEVGHLTAAGQAVNSMDPLTSANQSTGDPHSENFANTVAAAAAAYLNMPVLTTATNGYDATAKFAVPNH